MAVPIYDFVVDLFESDNHIDHCDIFEGHGCDCGYWAESLYGVKKHHEANNQSD